MNILVTGATRGIGKAICDLNKSGNHIYALGRNEELLKGYEDYIVCDLASDKSLCDMEKYISKIDIDILVNNAGEYIYSQIEKTDKYQIEHMIKVNLEAPLKLASMCVPNMKKKKWGRIINIGSISGVMGEANASVYSATKAGLIGASKALALELAEYGITVNTINPGWVNTELGNSSANEGDWCKAEIVECIPQKRFITPEEIAYMVKYLISDDAKGVTGQSINLCAGLSVGY